MGVLVARCDGRVSGREHYDFLQEQAALPPTVNPTEFVRLLGRLGSGGFIVIPEVEPPER